MDQGTPRIAKHVTAQELQGLIGNHAVTHENPIEIRTPDGTRYGIYEDFIQDGRIVLEVEALETRP